MAAVVEAVAPARRATLLPAGALGMLPLRAAWVEDLSAPTGRRYALDEVVLSYAPNARALTAARRLADGVAPDRLLAVDSPVGTDGRVLPHTGDEIADALRWFAQHRVLSGNEARVRTVLESLRYFSVLHFACHGFARPDPLDSSVLLAGGEPLRVADLMDAPVRARLAVLSACETAIPGGELPDEVVNLPPACSRRAWGASSGRCGRWPT